MSRALLVRGPLEASTGAGRDAPSRQSSSGRLSVPGKGGKRNRPVSSLERFCLKDQNWQERRHNVMDWFRIQLCLVKIVAIRLAPAVGGA
eukprot:7427790-Pyramimonas_sp.AAC.1